jgi:hypothetical protein
MTFIDVKQTITQKSRFKDEERHMLFCHKPGFRDYVNTLDLYSSLSIIRMIKSRRMRWEGHVTRMGEKRNAYRILVGKPRRRETTGKTKT